MKANKIQTKDIDKLPVLKFLEQMNGKWASWFPGFENSVANAMPEGTPEKIIQSVMKNLVQRGFVDGCTCGCRGDYVLTDKGKEAIKANTKPTVQGLFDSFNEVDDESSK